MLSRGSDLSTLPSGSPHHKVPSPAPLPGSQCMRPGVASSESRCSIRPPKPVFLSPSRSGSLSSCKTQGTMSVAARNLLWLSLIHPKAKFHPDSSEGLRGIPWSSSAPRPPSLSLLPHKSSCLLTSQASKLCPSCSPRRKHFLSAPSLASSCLFPWLL